MSMAEQPAEPRLEVFSPDEAIRRVHPLPSRDELVIEDVPDELWSAFQEALAEA